MQTFCPFINGNCITECVFNNGCFDEGDPENCNFMDAIRNIQSDGFVERTPKDYLEGIEDKLQNIKSNTGSDQTESYEIKNELEDISRKLDQIMKKL
jgi:hypothetical protein